MQINMKDFCILLVATMKLNGIHSFDINHISEQVGVFSDNFETRCLFANLCIGKSHEIIGMKSYLWMMLFSGYYYFEVLGTTWKIKIDEREALRMVKRYSVDHQKAMNYLVEEYQNQFIQKINEKI